MAITFDHYNNGSSKRGLLGRVMTAVAGLVLVGCATTGPEVDPNDRLFIDLQVSGLSGPNGQRHAYLLMEYLSKKDPAKAAALQKTVEAQGIIWTDVKQQAKVFEQEASQKAQEIERQRGIAANQIQEERAVAAFEQTLGKPLAKFNGFVQKLDIPSALAASYAVVEAYKVAPQVDRSRADTNLKNQIRATALSNLQRQAAAVTLYMAENSDKVTCPRQVKDEIVVSPAKNATGQNMPFTTAAAAQAICNAPKVAR